MSTNAAEAQTKIERFLQDAYQLRRTIDTTNVELLKGSLALENDGESVAPGPFIDTWTQQLSALDSFVLRWASEIARGPQS